MIIVNIHHDRLTKRYYISATINRIRYGAITFRKLRDVIWYIKIKHTADYVIIFRYY